MFQSYSSTSSYGGTPKSLGVAPDYSLVGTYGLNASPSLLPYWLSSWAAELTNAVAPAISGAAGTDLSTLPGWTKYGTAGTITMDGSSNLIFNSSDTVGAAYAYNLGSTTRLIEAKQISVQSMGHVSICIAVQDANNWLGCRLDAGGLTITGKVAGAFITDTTVVSSNSGGTVAPSPGWLPTIRIEVMNNTTVRYYIGGALRFTGAYPAGLASCTSVGMVSRLTPMTAGLINIPWMAAGRINHGHGQGIGQANQSARSQYINGKVYMGATVWTQGDNAVPAYGEARVYQIDPTTGATTHYAMGVGSGWGDGSHDTPGIAVRPDGRFIATYSQHSDTVGCRYRISVNPYDISAWSAEGTIAASSGTGGATYTSPYVMSATNNIYIFFRGPDTGCDYVTSSDLLTCAPATADGGALPTSPTFSALNSVILLPSGSAKGIYTSIWSDGVSRLDIIANNAVNAQGSDIDVRHAYLMTTTNTLYGTAGGVITQGQNGTFAAMTTIATSAAPDNLGNLFTLDVNRRSNGLIEAIFYENNSATDHRYYYATSLNGGAWTKGYIDAGTTPGTPDSLSGTIDVVGAATLGGAVRVGGAALDANTAGLMYVSVGNHTATTLYAYQTVNGGTSFVRSPVSPPSLPNPNASDLEVLSANVYPTTPRNAPTKCAVLWAKGRWDYYDPEVGYAYALDIMSAGSDGSTLVP